MKKILLILLLLNLQAFALEPIKVIDPKDSDYPYYVFLRIQYEK